ncbi:hypothetical protein MUK42_28758 [Musa troglodytarum]|uniref:Uncharacterized protein n=1 Tax=Musa troglodytarum TaxID=320322 RepID=A0A9E7FZD9_9LILI|nr:hypothetical protein MUK42_28758 [Musa troglodytarum]
MDQSSRAAPVLASPAAASAPITPASALKTSKSSHPPLKSPMVGTFYRTGPGLPPFLLRMLHYSAMFGSLDKALSS